MTRTRTSSEPDDISRKSRTIYDLTREINIRVRFGKNITQIKRELVDQNVLDMPEHALATAEEMIDDVIEHHCDYNAIQKIMRSKLVIDKDSTEVRIVDFRQRNYATITRENLREILHSKLDLSHKKYHCNFVYDPYSKNILTKNSNGFYKYNTYQPPAWYRDHFYSSGDIKVEKNEVVPAIYEEFLTHLTGGDKDSYEYILDWLAHGVRLRNFCILVTIGNQGVGKGLLGGMMRLLFGIDNYYEGTDRMIKSNFNSQMYNKKLVYIDEIFIKNKHDEDRIKTVVNDFIEVEKKGVDAQQIRNFASFYVSSNNLDSLKISADDRRFSIVNLTDEKLKKTWTVEKIRQLLKPSNIDELGKYLYYREVDEHTMLQNFLSKRTMEVRESAMSDWQDWLIGEYSVDKAGQEVPTTEVSDAISDKFGTRMRPGRKGLQQLMALCPEKLEVKKVTRKDKQLWVVKFPKGASE